MGDVTFVDAGYAAPPEVPAFNDKALAGTIEIDSQYLIDRGQQVIVIWQEVDGARRYATLQWHELEPGLTIHEYTLALGERQWHGFANRLRAITRETFSAREEETSRRALERRVHALQGENELLRQSLEDFRREQQIRAGVA